MCGFSEVQVSSEARGIGSLRTGIRGGYDVGAGNRTWVPGQSRVRS